MYDAIIVGAGPAGSSAAFHCNKLGLKTLLLDKSNFQGTKYVAMLYLEKVLSYLMKWDC